jgi:uncharacterized protein YggE
LYVGGFEFFYFDTILKLTHNSRINQILFFMPKYFVALLSLFLLFVVALTSVGAFMIYDNTRPISTLSVTDTLKKKVKPDQATVQLFISQTGTDLVKMNKENDAITVKVIDFLIKSGVSKDKIKTNKNSYPDFGIEPVIDGSKKPQLTVSETTIDVEFVNLNNNPNAILDETLVLGVNRFGAFNYKTADIKKMCDALETEVEKSVKVKAEQKVENIGGKIIKIQYSQTFVNNCENNSMPYYSSIKTGGGEFDGAQAPDLMTGEQEISATANLNVEYR